MWARAPRWAALLSLLRVSAAAAGGDASGGDWIFLAHHKSGTTVGEVLARQICEAHGRELKTHTFREAMAPAGKPACYFLIKAYLDDVGDWLDRAVDTQGRVVHIVRDPSAMVLSGYAFHRRGSEKVWTDTRRCSRDACDAHGAGAGLTKGQAAKVIFNGSVRPWLRAYGCAANSETYYACLRGAPAAVGLEIESRRAYATLRTMVAIHELLAPRPEYRAVCLEALRPEAFQDTVAELLRWLVGAEDSGAQSAEEIVANVTRACFDEKVHAISTHDERGDAAIDAATAAWRAKDGTPRVRELASRLKGLCGAKFTRETLVDEALVVPSGTLAAPAATWAGGASAAGKTPAFVREGKYANLEAHSRAGIVMCAAPRILDDAVRAVLRIRATGSELPIEVWHVAELDAAEIASIETSATGVKVLDLTSILRLTRDDEWVATRGFMCKPLALLATSLDEVVIVDSDSHVFADPAILLESEIYRRTGMLLFRDRHTTRTVGGSKVHSRGRYVRDLMQRRLNGVFGGKSPWRPSAALRASWMAAGESNHEIDSSIMLLHKSRNAAVRRCLADLLTPFDAPL
ncbi:mannosyltransferase putative-domain-containing protein [Pelagophyceae sp. CCMP2097]|nr:mannosyltransferase putative-domain-containing protein [Pelagophyceae sp. CCMP2097]